MLSCREASRLSSEAMDRPLKAGEKFSLHFHTLICRHCRRFKKQLGVIRQAAQQFSHKDESNHP